MLLAAAIMSAILPAHAQVAQKESTLRGSLNIGTLDSSIGDEGNSAVFLTNSEVGRKIFAVCNERDHCEVTGKVAGPLPQLMSVSRVRSIPIANASIFETPSFIVKIEVHCPEGNVTCEDVSYTGTSKKSGKSIFLKGRTMHTRCVDGTPCRFLGYTFSSGKVTYQIRDDVLIVMNGDETLVSESGHWK